MSDQSKSKLHHFDLLWICGFVVQQIELNIYSARTVYISLHVLLFVVFYVFYCVYIFLLFNLFDPLVSVADLQYNADGHYALPAPIAWYCLPSGSLPSIAGLSRLLLHASGTPCQRRRRQLSRWRHCVSISRHDSSDNRIQTSSSDLSFTECSVTAILL